MGTETTALTWSEKGELQKHEKVIQKGMQTFVDVGQALAAIRDNGLYRDDYKTFEAYCEKKWGFKRRYAYDLINSAEVTDNVRHGAQTAPASERQARPLSQLPESEQPQAWEEAQQESGSDQPTGKDVERVVARRKGEGESQPSNEQPTEPSPAAASDDEQETENEPEPEPADPLDEFCSDLADVLKELRSVKKQLRDTLGFEKDKATSEYRTNGLHRYTYSSTVGQLNQLESALKQEWPTGWDENGNVRTKRTDQLHNMANN